MLDSNQFEEYEDMEDELTMEAEWDEDMEAIEDQGIEAWLSEQWMENAMLHGID